MSLSLRMPVWLVALWLTGPLALAQAPTDEASAKAAEQSFFEWFQSKPRSEVFREAPGEANRRLEGIDFESLDVRTITPLASMLQFAPDLAGQAQARLELLGEAKDADGAASLSMAALLELVRTRRPVSGVKIARVLTHEGLTDAMNEGRALETIDLAASVVPADYPIVREPLIALAAIFESENASPELALAGGAFLAAVQRVDSGPDAAARFEELKTTVIAAVRQSFDLAPDTADAETLENLEIMIASLDGAHARGELLDHDAPDSAFNWQSDSDLPDSLAGLKGNVVVLDFWATWCMPCIASFPKIGELAAHYKDKPVTVLGLTTLQGRHVAGVGDETVTAGNPDLEYRLMSEFMDQRNMTWPVAFISLASWIEFGIEGIPHVAIIDKTGRVRYRGLSPFMPSEQKFEIIDALLAEDAG
ncbi:MAG: TlpA disulfide reductase family protein [Planctomycetota bacterium]